MAEKKRRVRLRQAGPAVSGTAHFPALAPPKKKRIVTVRRCEVCEGHGNIDGFPCRLCGGVGQHILTPVKEASK